jgi:hypothetical protein
MARARKAISGSPSWSRDGGPDRRRGARRPWRSRAEGRRPPAGQAEHADPGRRRGRARRGQRRPGADHRRERARRQAGPPGPAAALARGRADRRGAPRVRGDDQRRRRARGARHARRRGQHAGAGRQAGDRGPDPEVADAGVHRPVRADLRAADPRVHRAAAVRVGRRRRAVRRASIGRWRCSWPRARAPWRSPRRAPCSRGSARAARGGVLSRAGRTSTRSAASGDRVRQDRDADRGRAAAHRRGHRSSGSTRRACWRSRRRSSAAPITRSRARWSRARRAATTPPLEAEDVAAITGFGLRGVVDGTRCSSASRAVHARGPAGIPRFAMVTACRRRAARSCSCGSAASSSACSA